MSGERLERGDVKNFLRLYHYATEWEKREGAGYYTRQRDLITAYGLERGADVFSSLRKVVAAFCVLSPNQTEKTNYQALDRCLKIVTGQLPESTSVAAYGKNKVKALALLRGGEIEKYVTGRKVRSFYENTIDPDNNTYVTVDGHMLSVWCGWRILLKTKEANISETEYSAISDDMRIAANFLGYSAPRLQAILWLAWKRVNRIVYSPQTAFEFENLTQTPWSGPESAAVGFEVETAAESRS